MAFQYNNQKGITYYLHSTDVTLRGSNRVQRIYFFAKDVRKNSLDEIPDGYTIAENKKTGLPTLKKK